MMICIASIASLACCAPRETSRTVAAPAATQAPRVPSAASTKAVSITRAHASAAPAVPVAPAMPVATVAPVPTVARPSAQARTLDAAVRGPQLYSVSVTPSVVHAGDAVHWDAYVSSDVKAVTCRVAVYTFALHAVRHGHFGVTFAIPKDVPPFFHGKYAVTVTASASDGTSTARVVPLSFE